MRDKEKLEAIKKVLDDYPKHIFYRKADAQGGWSLGVEYGDIAIKDTFRGAGAAKDFEEALDEIHKIVKED